MEMILAFFLIGGGFAISHFILSILDKNLENKIRNEELKKQQNRVDKVSH
jgi:hypothetical protein